MSEDERLVQRFQSGSEDAFDELVERYRRRVYSLACRLVGPREADDLAQEVFIAAYKALPGFRKQSTFSTWIYRITVHICSHHLRRRKIDTSELEEYHADGDREHDPERCALQGELRDRVHGAIDRLPYKLRLVVALRDLHGLSYEEIAGVVGCPIGTVRSRLHYATQRLAGDLSPYVEAKQ
jgi:RNA polymerase sigma-70 factor (ECF subfamily)